VGAGAGGTATVKVAICGKRFTPAAGGAETFTISFARGLAEAGHEVHVFAFDAGESSLPVKVHRLPVKNWPKMTRDLSFAMRCKRAVQRESFDAIFGLGKVIHVNVLRPGGGVHMNYVRQDCQSSYWIWGVPLRWAKHTFGPKDLINAWIEKQVYQCPALKRVVANSNMVKRHLQTRYGFDDAFISVIHNAADTERFCPSHRATIGRKIRGELGVGEQECVVLRRNVEHDYYFFSDEEAEGAEYG
jgi:UDP-glucose:(heptosyl)LPS alpha-1,3-glucosyltransferase